MIEVPALYSRARNLVRNGDLLLWRPTRWQGAAIAEFTDSEYSHAAMAAWWGDALMAVEFLQWHGGRTITLSSQVRRWPGRCDVHRVPKLHGYQAAQDIVRRCGAIYGWTDFLRIAAARLLPRLPRPTTAAQHVEETIAADTPLVCSGAVAQACRAAGRDAKPGTSVHEIVPGDLARPFSEYRFTLYWNVLPPRAAYIAEVDLDSL